MSKRSVGRPKLGLRPKTPIGPKVTQETIERILELKEKSGVSASIIIEWAFRCKIKKIPKDIKDIVNNLPRT